jgi:hypothetical protein
MARNRSRARRPSAKRWPNRRRDRFLDGSYTPLVENRPANGDRPVVAGTTTFAGDAAS